MTPAAQDARKLVLPLSAVAVLLAAAVGWGSSWMANKAHTEETSRQLEEVKTTQREQDKRLNDHDVRIGQHDTSFQFIRESLDRIEKSLGTK